MLLKKIEKGRFVFKLHQDDSAHYLYKDHFESVFFKSFHRQYSNEGDEKLVKEQGIKKVEIYGLDHSGMALSLEPFNCPWDSGLFGLLYFRDGEFGEKDQGLKGFVSSMQALINGEVFGFTLEEKKQCNHCHHDDSEEISACWGFYGYKDQDSMIEEMLGHCEVDADIRSELLAAL
jgi:hypothetical protein